MIGVIIGCEIAFWVLILAGLACRYLLKWKKTGSVLLLLTPGVDIVLLAVTVIHLKQGAEATFVHGLSAVYIGVSIAFGHAMIRWADERFAHRFAGGAAPKPKARFGREHARQERLGWFKHLLAWAIGCLCLAGMIYLVDDADSTEQLVQVIRLWSVVLGIDFLISFSYTLSPKKEKHES
ncbi:hypothetical protein [Cohnella hashimotonis]|uniref:2TM domain-containing protein n=1 Tax=Cohnella hashimotonis TaxID=2826895 RepID=A0ABT6TPB4_9BACL|nr:hypothetical protein [Cohnella hashimotonis]MDI4648696.1 hypothetical protein [Cohnella hashimotonis]